MVGQSGSGKSTLVKLIQRFYNVNDGRVSVMMVVCRSWTCCCSADTGVHWCVLSQVLFDGHDLARTDMSKLRNHIAVVSQVG